MSRRKDKVSKSPSVVEGAVEQTVDSKPEVSEDDVTESLEETSAVEESTEEVPASEEVLVEETVIATVPKAFKLRIDSHKIVEIRAGVHRMLKSYAEHWYSKVNGVTIFEDGGDHAA